MEEPTDHLAGRESFRLTLVKKLEAAVGATAVCSEEQIQEAAAAEQEVRNLSAVQRGDEWRQQVWTIVDLQEVVIELGLEPARNTRKKNRIGAFLFSVFFCLFFKTSLRQKHLLNNNLPQNNQMLLMSLRMPQGDVQYRPPESYRS